MISAMASTAAGRLWDVDTGVWTTGSLPRSVRDSVLPNEISRATVALWPTAYRFKRGHRIRVQVSSGAFPRYARKPGTGEPHATATTLKAADQDVYHDHAHPSAVLLPVRAAS
ncbi:CocE/NonD family hydrolase C-terminal non-catalytic domain-containing protein [Nonomuraea basaltis]|uniref:CocE/NonD family hydrolase C-terminal non-catalytic domain-containing protein n=1 Tax=Nonomuraea basaltis TaxID=2495887 RepID=UPI001F0D7FAB|nr:CocE/NonD family hydrolase C-terminal non-catalytic domain-containing protein [Nonomuraea basaltis]